MGAETNKIIFFFYLPAAPARGGTHTYTAPILPYGPDNFSLSLAMGPMFYQVSLMKIDNFKIKTSPHLISIFPKFIILPNLGEEGQP